MVTRWLQYPQKSYLHPIMLKCRKKGIQSLDKITTFESFFMEGQNLSQHP